MRNAPSRSRVRVRRWLAARVALLTLTLPAIGLAQDSPALAPGIYPPATRALLADPDAGPVLGPLLRRRDAALGADAYLYAPSEWKRAEDRLANVVSNLERGRVEPARKRAEDAGEFYRQAHLRALEATILGDVDAAVTSAERERLSRRVPGSMARARALVEQAREQLQASLDEGEPATGRARALADEATVALEHARYLHQVIAVAADTQGEAAAAETVLLEWERIFREVAEAAGTSPDFGRGPQPPADAIVDAIADLRSRVSALETELDRRNGQIRELQTQLTASDEQLSDVARQRTRLEDQLAAQARVRAQFSTIEGMFAPGQAEVVREGDQLILRLVGLAFDVGSSEIGEDQQALLDQVVQAIKVFPNSQVTVEGHTDSQGADERNMTLSRDRARSVRERLLQRSGIVSTRITSDGFGETRPIASNDTREGRAMNRRIDVRIDPRLSLSR